MKQFLSVQFLLTLSCVYLILSGGAIDLGSDAADDYSHVESIPLEKSLETLITLPIHYYFDVLKGSYRIGVLGESIVQSHPQLVIKVDKKVLLKPTGNNEPKMVSVDNLPVVDSTQLFTHMMGAVKLLSERSVNFECVKSNSSIRKFSVDDDLRLQLEEEHQRLRGVLKRINDMKVKPKSLLLRRETLQVRQRHQQLLLEKEQMKSKAAKEVMGMLLQDRRTVHLRHHEALINISSVSYAIRSEVPADDILESYSLYKDSVDSIGPADVHEENDSENKLVEMEFEHQLAVLKAEYSQEIQNIKTRQAEFVRLEKMNEPIAQKLIETEHRLGQIESSQVLDTFFVEMGVLFNDVFGTRERIMKLSAAIFGFLILFAISLELAPALRSMWSSMTRKRILNICESHQSWLFRKAVVERMLDKMTLSRSVREILVESAELLRNASETRSGLPFVLLHGEAGTGKSMGARALAIDSGLAYATLCGADLQALGSKAGLHLRLVLEAAEKRSTPLVVIIDEADAIIANRVEVALSKSLPSSCLYCLLQSMRHNSQKLSIILTTRRPVCDVDSAILDRLDRVVHFQVPETRQRLEFALKRSTSLLGPYLDTNAMQELNLILQSMRAPAVAGAQSPFDSIIHNATVAWESLVDSGAERNRHISPENDRPVQLALSMLDNAMSRPMLVELELKAMLGTQEDDDAFDVRKAMHAFLLASDSWSYRDLEKFFNSVMTSAVSTKQCRVKQKMWLSVLHFRVAQSINLVNYC